MAAPPLGKISATLAEVLRDCNVHASLHQALQQQELLTAKEFAYEFPTLSHLDSFFSGPSLSITDAASSVHCARHRRAVDKCHAAPWGRSRLSLPHPCPLKPRRHFLLQPDWKSLISVGAIMPAASATSLSRGSSFSHTRRCRRCAARWSRAGLDPLNEAASQYACVDTGLAQTSPHSTCPITVLHENNTQQYTA